MEKLVVLIGVVVLLHANGSSAEHAMGSSRFSNEEALALSQSTLGQRVGDYEFIDIEGKPVSLQDFRGKPLLISLIYTSCYHICPTTTRYLHEVVVKGRDVLGQDSFNVVTIGFDVIKDSPAMMEQFARKQNVDAPGWWFLSGDEKSIDGIAGDLGFIFYPSPNGFDHLIQTSIVDAKGEIYAHIYGMSFEVPLMIEPLKQLVLGERQGKSLVAMVGDRVRLFCTVYDPANDRYRIDYSIFIGTFIAFGCVGVLGLQLTREWRKHFRASGSNNDSQS
jgi:protein SCO1/2